MLSRILQPRAAQCLKPCTRNMVTESVKTRDASKLLNTNTRVKKPFVKQVRNNDIKRYNHTLTSKNTMKKEPLLNVRLRERNAVDLVTAACVVGVCMFVAHSSHETVTDAFDMSQRRKFTSMDELDSGYVSSMTERGISYKMSGIPVSNIQSVARSIQAEIDIIKRKEHNVDSLVYSKGRMIPWVLLAGAYGLMGTPAVFLGISGGGIGIACLLGGGALLIGGHRILKGARGIQKNKCHYEIRKDWINQEVTVFAKHRDGQKIYLKRPDSKRRYV